MTSNDQTTSDDLLNVNEVCAVLRCSHSTIYNWMAIGRFPKPLRLSPRFVRWQRSTVDGWLAAQGS